MIINDIDTLSAMDLRVIILGLKVSMFNINDESVSNDICHRIDALPSAEAINTVLGNDDSFMIVRQEVGSIMELVDKYGSRDKEYKIRYKAKTGLDPRYKVLDYVFANGEEQEKLAMAGDKIKKEAAPNLMDVFKGKFPSKTPVAKDIGAKILKSRMDLYSSFTGLLSAMEAAKSMLPQIGNEHEKQAIQNMVNELKGTTDEMRASMRSINWSQDLMEKYIDDNAAESKQQADRPQSAEELKGKHDEAVERESAEDIKRKQQMADGMSAGESYYYVGSDGNVKYVQLRDNTVNEYGKVQVSSSSGAWGIEADRLNPSKNIFNILQKKWSDFQKETNDVGYSSLNDVQKVVFEQFQNANAQANISNTPDSLSKFPRIPPELSSYIFSDTKTASKKFNLKRRLSS